MNLSAFAALLKEQPIAVTGIGAFTAAGATADALWTSVAAGESPAAWLPANVQSGAGRMAGCVAPEVIGTTEPFRIIRRMDRSAQLGMAAAVQAWADAELATKAWNSERIGIIVGTSRGPVGKWTESMERLAKGRMLPTLAANSTIAGLSGSLSLAFQVQGPSLTVSSACSSSASAIVLGAQQILTGAADIVLVGGAEAPLDANVLAQLHRAGVLGHHDDPRQICRPFDSARNGTILGEGAAFIVLESLATARERGVEPQATLTGWALGSEGTERTGMSDDGEGLYRVMVQALDLAGLSPTQIDYVNAHGTGTPLNDRMEARALDRLFDNRGLDPNDPELLKTCDRVGITPSEREKLLRRVSPLPCSSTKPVTGHCMGAAAAIEAVIAIQALKRQQVPPTINCPNPIASPALNLIREGTCWCQLKHIMSNSSGFWGTHASLIFTAANHN